MRIQQFLLLPVCFLLCVRVQATSIQDGLAKLDRIDWQSKSDFSSRTELSVVRSLIGVKTHDPRLAVQLAGKLMEVLKASPSLHVWNNSFSTSWANRRETQVVAAEVLVNLCNSPHGIFVQPIVIQSLPSDMIRNRPAKLYDQSFARYRLDYYMNVGPLVDLMKKIIPASPEIEIARVRFLQSLRVQ